MTTRTIIAEDRPGTGTGNTRRLRKTNKIPAILYGSGTTRPVAIDAHSFEVNFKYISENEIISLKIGKESVNVLIKGYQRDILMDRTTHIDFYKVDSEKELRTNVPVKLVGSPKGVRDGGILEHPTYEIEVSCLPADLPEVFEVNVAALELGHAIHIGDIEVPAGVKILSNHDQVLASVAHPRVQTEEAAAEGAEPELKADAPKQG